jgi:hypothetical protein
MDFIPTFAAAAGDSDIVEKLLKGTTLNGKPFKVHLEVGRRGSAGLGIAPRTERFRKIAPWRSGS